MSYHIKVNHSQFKAAADAIDTYISRHNKNMSAAGREVTLLGSSWQGKDAAKFQQQWNRVDDHDSTSKNMTKALEQYADFLRFAAKEYKDAQAKAVNKANRL